MNSIWFASGLEWLFCHIFQINSLKSVEQFHLQDWNMWVERNICDNITVPRHCTRLLHQITLAINFPRKSVSLFLFKLPPGVKTSRRKCLFFTLVFLGYCHRSIQQVHGNGLLQITKLCSITFSALGIKFLSILWWNIRNNRAYIHWILAIYSQSEHWSGLVDIP